MNKSGDIERTAITLLSRLKTRSLNHGGEQNVQGGTNLQGKQAIPFGKIDFLTLGS